MKKLIILIGLITNIYAIPPCDMPQEKVCAYLYKSPMGAEIIITNMSTSKIIVKRLKVSLDGNYKIVKDLTLSSGQNFTVLKSRYDKDTQKPYYNIGTFDYENIK